MGVRLIFCFTLLVLLVSSMRGELSIMDYFKLKRSLSILENSVERLQEENSSIAEEIRKIKSSPAYARKVLRDKYHVTDPDEKIIFFAD